MVPDPLSGSKPRVTSATDPCRDPSRIRPMSTPQQAGAPAELPGVYRPGQRAIVVGASSGMGAAVVRQLADEGYTVVALARRADALALAVWRDADGEQIPRAIGHPLWLAIPEAQHIAVNCDEPDVGCRLAEIPGDHVVKHLTRKQVR